MCGLITLSFSAIIRGAATSQNCGVHPSPSLPPSLLLSLRPCFPILCLFPFFFISLRPYLRFFLNTSLPSSLFRPLFSFFLFLSRGPATRHLKPASGVRESCKPGRQTVSVHSEVKTGFWWVVTAVLKRFAYNERQLQVTRDTKIWGVGHSSPIFWGVRISTTPKVTAPLSMISKSKPTIWSFYFFR